MRSNFRTQHPELVDYEEARTIFIAQHPELLPYLMGDDNEPKDAPIEVAMEVYDYRAERALRYPRIKLTEDAYYDTPKAERKAFLKQHPELKEYWDWNDATKDELSTAAWYYVESDSKINKLRYGDSYQAPYYVDYDKFSPDLTMALAQMGILNGRLGSGARAQLKRVWENEGRPLKTFDAWLEMVTAAFVLE
jgi:hypothetical protein